MKTREEVEALKKNWVNDPIRTLPTTEGFEEYRSELEQFQDEQEAKWEAERKQKTTDTANATGVDKHTAKFIKTFKEIELMLQLDHVVGDCGSAIAYADYEISRAQVRATLLLAAQVMRVADILENWSGFEKYIRGD